MILSAKDIAQQLASRVDSFARWIFPNGRLESGNWCVGSVNGEAGGSLRVQLTGPRAGVWADFAGDDRGDMLDLIVAAKSVTMGEAIKLAKDWLGIRDPESVVPKKEYRKPKPVPVPTRNGHDGAVMDYLMNERCLDGLTVRLFQISQCDHADNGPEIVFQSMSPGGELVNVKYIALKRQPDGKKIVRQSGGCAPSLFGWQVIPKGCREIIITEGEIDAITWTALGYHALSIPDGAEGQTWIDYDWENLQQFDTIWLNWDNDEVGQKAVKKVAKRLGLHRCLILTIPGYKDANEALQHNAPESLYSSAIAAAKPIEPEVIKSPAAFRDKVQERFHPADGSVPGFRSTLLGSRIRFRPGELTVWTGITSHGKSAVLNQLMLEAVLCGYKVAIASMEMPGDQTLHRMLCQSEMRIPISREEIDADLGWLSGKLWIYDLMGNVEPKTLLDLMEYSFSRHGVNMFVIDSLMKCAVDSEDWNAQRVVLNDLCQFPKDTGTHVHLVAHARKGRDEIGSPGKLDVKGSSDIVNQPDNVLTVHRNRAKEQAIEDRDESKRGEHDATIFCNKQRETGEEFKVRLRFMKGFFRFAIHGEEGQTNLSILQRILPPEPEPQEPELIHEPEPDITGEPVPN